MTDKRRRRWVAHDVYFLNGPLGEEIYDRYGATGVALWFAFIAAAKKHHIEGRITYSADPEALAVFGLPGLELIDTDDQPFTLDDFFQVTGDHKVTRRSKRGRRTTVICTRWEAWQNPRHTRPPVVDNPSGSRVGGGPEPVDSRVGGDSEVPRSRVGDGPEVDDSSDAASQHRRSEQETTTTTPSRSNEKEPADSDLDLDLDLDPDITPLPPVPDPPDVSATDAGGDDHLEQLLTRLPAWIRTNLDPAHRCYLADHIDAAIADGWTLASLRTAILDQDRKLGALDELDDRARVGKALVARIVAAGPPNEPKSTGPPCPTCDDRRVVDLDDGTAGACPTCRPDVDLADRYRSEFDDGREPTPLADLLEETTPMADPNRPRSRA